jgi:large subunit ribosomal protein L32e
MKDTNRLLRLRQTMKRKRPRFLHQEHWKLNRFKKAPWRKPKGKRSKMRVRERAKPFLVSVGYRSPRAVRGWHPLGAPEILVHTVRDIDRIAGAGKPQKAEVAQPQKKSKRKSQKNRKSQSPEISCVLRIASGVGSRKKVELVKAAQEKNLYVANPRIKVAKVSSLEELESLLPIKDLIQSWYVSDNLTEDEREDVLERAEEVGIEVVE